jgi:hypothetical protein
MQDIIALIKSRAFPNTGRKSVVTDLGGFIDKAGEDLDSQKMYEDNLKSQPDNWYYRTNKVYYNFNSKGYRAKEFDQIDWNNSIVLFGCSNTLGIGLEESNTIASKIELKTGIPTINMGISGASMFRSFNDSLILAENNYKPKAVVNIWTQHMRTTLYRKRDILNIGLWNQDSAEGLGKLWFKDETNPKVHSLFIKMAAKQVWQTKAKYFECSFFESTANLLSCPVLDIVDSSRDLMHPGIDSADKAADNIIKGLSL